MWQVESSRACASFTISLELLEVGLRTFSDETFKAAHGRDWLTKPGVIRARHLREMIKDSESGFKARGTRPTPQRLLSDLPLSFRIKLLAKNQEMLWRDAEGRAKLKHRADSRRIVHGTKFQELSRFRNFVSHRKLILDQDLPGRHSDIMKALKAVAPTLAERCAAIDPFVETFPFGRIPTDVPPDPQRRAKVVQLACAVTERIGASSPFDPALLSSHIDDALWFAEISKEVPGKMVEARAEEIARTSAETDLRVRVTKGISRNMIHESRARYEGHPGFYRRDQIDAYEATLARETEKFAQERVEPTELERLVARLDLASRGTPYQGMAQVLSIAIEHGRPAGPAAILQKWEALVRVLEKPVKGLKKFEKCRLAGRLYRSSTDFEVKEMCRNRIPHLGNAADANKRKQIANSARDLHVISFPDPSPWRALHERQGFSMGRVPAHVRVRSLAAEG